MKIFSFSAIARVLLAGSVFGGVLWLIIAEYLLERPDTLHITRSGAVEMCLSCHKDEKLDAAHDEKVIGCSPCHLGNPLAITKKAAHEGIALNPGGLRVAGKTCSVSGCHPTDIHRVKNSLMATNRGILGTLLYYWGETDSQNTDITVRELLESGESSLAIDYFRKLCSTCHLWKQKNDLPGAPDFFNQKGGGCSACHYYIPNRTEKNMGLAADGDEDGGKEDEKKIHPHITSKVRSVNCVRCHNRSGRIGISYMGIFESEGYGSPFEKGGLSSRQLPGARFYLEVADDIHHKKGMECIDCHTQNEIMGDGTSYAHYEEQLEISCLVCHSSDAGVTTKGERLNNVEERDGSLVLIGKVDGRVRPLKMPKKNVCDFSAHRRVSCEACHSTWVAQCYGCHVKRDASGTHLDKLSLEETEGLWVEGRSYIRYERPMLGVWDENVVVVTPGCQDIVTVVDADGEVEKSFDRFTMAAINPHTTQAKGRDCLDCHASTKTVGLGEGRLLQKNGQLYFEGIDKGIKTTTEQTVPFDSYVNIQGAAQQFSSRASLRPFNSNELKRILRVGLCVRCHDSYDDPVWKSYTSSTICADPSGQIDTSGFAVSNQGVQKDLEPVSPEKIPGKKGLRYLNSRGKYIGAQE